MIYYVYLCVCVCIINIFNYLFALHRQKVIRIFEYRLQYLKETHTYTFKWQSFKMTP